MASEYALFCYETCSRDEAATKGEQDEPMFFVHLPTREISKYLEFEPRELPVGARYVRPLEEAE